MRVGLRSCVLQIVTMGFSTTDVEHPQLDLGMGLKNYSETMTNAPECDSPVSVSIDDEEVTQSFGFEGKPRGDSHTPGKPTPAAAFL